MRRGTAAELLATQQAASSNATTAEPRSPLNGAEVDEDDDDGMFDDFAEDAFIAMEDLTDAQLSRHMEAFARKIGGHLTLVVPQPC